MPRTFVNKPNKVVESAEVPSADGKFVHEVHLLDGSGSMGGNHGRTKFTNAVVGINADINSSITAAKSTGIGGTLSIYQFSDPYILNARPEHGNIVNVPILQATANYNPQSIGSGTPLYQAIGEVINRYIKLKGKDDKVLLKIFTDGGENSSKGEYAPGRGLRGYNLASPALAELIARAEKEHGFTITFVGTSSDVKSIISNLGVNETNTFTHNNTLEGVEHAFMATNTASMNYRSSYSKGLDVSHNFYSKSTD